MPRIYVVSGDNTEETPVEFTGNVAELVPDDVFYQDPRYRAIVDESVTRRKKIKELESLQHASQTPDPAAPATPAPTPPVDEDALYRNFRERQAREAAEANQANAALVALLAPNGLDESFLSILEEAKDPAKVAVELGRKKLSFANSGANPANVPNAADIFANINKSLGLK
jgi:hypothetical protein